MLFLLWQQAMWGGSMNCTSLPPRLAPGRPGRRCSDPCQGASDKGFTWAEVYVDGGGWRGFDPTTGLAVGDNHIAVARAHPLRTPRR
jgi:hypothetical protein